MKRHNLNFAGVEKVAGIATVMGAVWPGVRIEIADAAMQIESPMTNVQFQPAANGKSVEVLPLLQAAA